ncbi:transposase [Slackia piriformis]|uniref:transposase n=1 Tax=Slackia piriformis TaxID=626934 RepID=UPI0032BFFD0E
MANPAAEYTDKFRCETADCIISTGRPAAECCRELGLNPETVDKWVARRRREISDDPNPKAGERELREAQKRIRELEMENAFLKKAAAFFAKEQGWPRATGSCWRRRPNSRFR